ncbi:MAG: hypothetical protein FJW69_03505 [Actinobacteria bacterium]|nr:hypothetical protein [Actinomycetota bacterium]MBM3713095.1 hypothetical protein [Actinomycetota bacterium]
MNKNEINEIKNNINKNTINIIYSLIRSEFAVWKRGRLSGSSYKIIPEGKKTSAELVIEDRI